MKKLILITFVCLLGSFSTSFANKKTLHPGAHKVGFYSGISTGRVFYSGADRSLFKDGWVTGLKFGYDFIKYLGVEGIFKFSGHDAATGTQQTGIPKSFFVYQYILQAKGSFPVMRRLYLNMGLGGGIWQSSPNQKSTVGGASRSMLYGDLGVEYFMRTRGLSVGLDPSWAAVKDLKGLVFQMTGFLRYTF